MRVGILGGTGFIGKHLVKELIQGGDQVVLWSREPKKVALPYVEQQDNLTIEKWPLSQEASYSLDAIINLAGETINQRWSSKAKEKILQSRLNTTKQVIHYLKEGKLKSPLLINGSAIGYYGTSLEDKYTESSNAGEDFLATVVRKWEEEANKVEELGIRLVMLRMGVVLGEDGGALPKMLLPYRLFVGGPIGSGQQWISWIHIKDVVELIRFAMHNSEVAGALNLTAPTPLRMNNFGKLVGEVLKRPHLIPLPAFVMRLLLGEMSDLLLKGQHVYPEKALEKGYYFRYPKLKEALMNIEAERKEPK